MWKSKRTNLYANLSICSPKPNYVFVTKMIFTNIKPIPILAIDFI